MRHILVVNSSGHVGGSEKILLGFLKTIDKKDTDIFAIAPSSGKFKDLLLAANIPCEVLPGLYDNGFVTRDESLFLKPLKTFQSISAIFDFSFAISSYIKQHSVDVVISNGVKAFLSGGLAAKSNRKRSIWLLQDILPASLFKAAIFLCGRILADKIIAVSCAVKESIPPLMRRRTNVIYPFLSKEEVEAQISSRSLRGEFGIKDNETVIGIVGKVIPSKGIEFFLEAFAEIAKDHKDIKAMIVGDAKLEVASPVYEDEIKLKVRNLGLDEKVIFTGWRDDIYNIFKTIDILVHVPMRPEGFGRVLVEAMLSSRAVIAFDYPSALEILEDGVSGILVKRQDKNALIRNITHLINNRKRMESIGSLAKKIVEERFIYNSPLYPLDLSQELL